MDDAGARQRPSHRRTAVDAVVVALLWLVLAWQFDGQELAVAAVTGLVAAGFAARVRRRLGHEGRRLPPGTAGVLARAWVGALTDTGPLVRALSERLRGRPSRSRLREVPFRLDVDVDPGDADPHEAGRRALASLTCSLQPNSYLVAYDRERQVALVHELIPTDDPPIDAVLRGGA